MIRLLIVTLGLLVSGSCFAQFAQFQASSTASPPPFNTQVFNCTGYGSSGGPGGPTCGMATIGQGANTFKLVGTTSGSSPGFSGSQILLVPSGGVHVALNVNFQTVVSVTAFQSTFQFVPDGQGIAFILQNSTNNLANLGSFSSGASCEGAFFQGETGAQVDPPNFVFALMLDQYGGNAAGSATFTYSSAQWYRAASPPPDAPNGPGQSPCNPNDDTPDNQNFTYVGVNKLSTSPVPLNSPAGTLNTTTGDTYSATVTYSSTTQVLELDLYDITAGGTCAPVTSGTCYHNTWSGVDIPTTVGNTTAYVGLGGATGTAAVAPLLIGPWTYFTP